MMMFDVAMNPWDTAAPQSPLLPVVTCRATICQLFQSAGLPIPHVYSPMSSGLKSFISTLNAPELSWGVIWIRPS